MSRLIDADKIDFNEVFKGSSDFATDMRKAARTLIDAQPNAYNVEKVVEQLEYLRFAFDNDECEPAKGESCTGGGMNDCAYCMVGRAIEIVKGGGVNG